MFTDWNAWAGPESIFNGMVKQQADLLGKMANTMGDFVGQESGRSRTGGFKPHGDFLNSGENFWKPMMFFMPPAGIFENYFKQGPLSQDKLTGMFQSMFEGLGNGGNLWTEQAERVQEFAKRFNVNGLDQQGLGRIFKIYEEEFRRVLNVPKIGLTRLYQERVSEAMDKFNKFNSQMTEFMVALSKPVDESFLDLKEELQEMAKAGSLPESLDAYFQKWMNALEDKYLNYFKTADYNNVLSQTMESMGEFVKVRDEMIQDLIKGMPVPTQQEMDDLYKDLYVLKKKIREMEKQNKKDKPEDK